MYFNDMIFGVSAIIKLTPRTEVYTFFSWVLNSSEKVDDPSPKPSTLNTEI